MKHDKNETLLQKRIALPATPRAASCAAAHPTDPTDSRSSVSAAGMSLRGALSSCPFGVYTRQATPPPRQDVGSVNARAGRFSRASTEVTKVESISRLAVRATTGVTERPGSCRRSGKTATAWQGGRAEFNPAYLTVGHRAFDEHDSAPAFDKTGARASYSYCSKVSKPSDPVIASVDTYSIGSSVSSGRRKNGDDRFMTMQMLAEAETAEETARSTMPRGAYFPRVIA